MLSPAMAKWDRDTMIEGQKLISALQELSKEHFSISDDTILDKLYVHIEASAAVKNLLDSVLPEIGEWLDIVMKMWSENALFDGVQIFTLRFIGLVGSTGKGFDILNDKNVLVHIRKLATNIEVQNNSCLMVPLTNALGLFLKHRAGWEWITGQMVWKSALNAYYDDRSIYSKRAVVKFISLFISSSALYDNNVSVQVLNSVCAPLIANNLLSVKMSDGVADRVQQLPVDSAVTDLHMDKSMTVSELLQTAHLLCDILEDLLSTDASMPEKLSLALQYGEDGDACQSTLFNVLNNCSSFKDHEAFSLLLLMVELSNAFKMYVSMEKCPLDLVYGHIYKVFTSMISHGHFMTVIKFFGTCLSWRAKFKQKVGICDEGCESCLQFENTVAHCLRSVLHLHSCCDGCRMYTCNEISHRSKIKNQTSPIGGELYNKLSSKCLATADVNTAMYLGLQYIQLGVFAITRSMNLFTSVNAVSILSDVIGTLNSMQRHYQYYDVLTPVLINLMTLTSKLLETCGFEFWKNKDIIKGSGSEEILLILIQFVNYNSMDLRVAITSIQTIKKVFQFLVIHDMFSVAVKITPITAVLNEHSFKFTLSSTSWEVRDSILELYQTIIELGELTAQLFSGILNQPMLENILQATSTDESAYVRASALNFFAKAARAKLLDHFHMTPTFLLDSFLRTLSEDDVPVVRRAACEVITALYITYVPLHLKDPHVMHEAVFKISMRDLDWEVKKAALSFWKCTIDKHLLDGLVPVDPSLLYYSKEPDIKEKMNSKIITIINTLGDIGCLKAIWLGVKDDCDLKVAQDAQNIINFLLELDKKWNFIDNILNCDEVVEQKEDEVPYQKLSPKEFFSLVQSQDWSERLDSRREWIENTCDDLTSLLDHILNADNRMDDCDRNTVDCY